MQAGEDSLLGAHGSIQGGSQHHCAGQAWAWEHLREACALVTSPCSKTPCGHPALDCVRFHSPVNRGQAVYRWFLHSYLLDGTRSPGVRAGVLGWFQALIQGRCAWHMCSHRYLLSSCCVRGSQLHTVTQVLSQRGSCLWRRCLVSCWRVWEGSMEA